MVLSAGAAGADDAVLPPVGGESVEPRQLQRVKAGIERVLKKRAGVSMAAGDGAKVDASCAVEVACLAKQGAALGVDRIVGVVVAARGRNFEVTFVMVDVKGAREVVRSTRTVKKKRMKKDPGRLLRAFLKKAGSSAAPDRTELSRQRFVAGNSHYKLGEYQKALAEYKEAFRIKPLPGFLYNIAQCHRKLGHWDQAIKMYKSYLSEVPGASNRAVVEDLIAESEAGLGKQRESDREKSAEAARLEAARRKAEQERLEAERKKAEAGARSAAELRAAEEARVEAQREREATYNRHPFRTWSLVGIGVGAAALGGGALFAVRASDAQSSFDDLKCGDPTEPLDAMELAQCRDFKDDKDRDSLLRNVFAGTGAAILVGSITLLITDPGNIEPPASTTRVQVSAFPPMAFVSVTW